MISHIDTQRLIGAFHYWIVSYFQTQVKTDYEEHAVREHPEDLPEDLTPEPVAKTGADLNSMQVT